MRSAHGENGTTPETRRYDDAVPRGKRPMGILPNVLRITRERFAYMYRRRLPGHETALRGGLLTALSVPLQTAF